ncbi:ABC transporter ATP-binding protein [Salinibacillus xinjiangensis]|uniref:ATP-binding cassette domain-containing protein n=1 Tax=Salinibacillus xinjiangensis TaxID=1229268 RepID=A0A6G1X952_9BACI|nr:ABC transporter ATP-binding protein [Salinibacillus xinjiangensis]MRG87436.1 ATP-binding cassette domain-containing protein [Salinibacillus xinjiangensis]
MSSMVKVNGLAHSFGREDVLKEIDLTVSRGEIFGLLGPSGAGKTTLVKMIVGILEPDEGGIFIGDEKVPSLDLMRSIGYMAQSDALYQELSAKENLDFLASIYGLNKQERKEAIHDVLQIVNLQDHKNKIVNQFSGGMKRRLSLAASLMHKPNLLILDEPTVGIDPVLRQSIWEELTKLKENGMTILVTTHVMDEAEKCDRLAMLRDGYVIACDTPEKLKENKQVESLEGAFLAYGGRNL